MMKKNIPAILFLMLLGCGGRDIHQPLGPPGALIPPPGIDPGHRGSTARQPASCAHCLPGQTCDVSGRCYCDPTSCFGCCHSDGTCRSDGASSNLACGINGAPCAMCFNSQCRAGRCDGCHPNCTGRMCGGDGCGGVCGFCPAGSQCSFRGICECIPDCYGKCAGAADGCGGTCPVSRCVGCCYGTMCLSGDDPRACGREGRSCQICGPGELCYHGSCANAYYIYNPPSMVQPWNVGVLSQASCAGYLEWPGQAFHCGGPQTYCDGYSYQCQSCPAGYLNCDGYQGCETWSPSGSCGFGF